MNRTESLFKSYHLWTYLAKTGEKSKEKAYKTFGLKADTNNCPLCKYVYGLKSYRKRNGDEEPGYDTGCNNQCPVNWTPSNYVCVNPHSPYERWVKAKTLTERKKYAKEVLNLIVEAMRKFNVSTPQTSTNGETKMNKSVFGYVVLDGDNEGEFFKTEEQMLRGVKVLIKDCNMGAGDIEVYEVNREMTLETEEVLQITVK